MSVTFPSEVLPEIDWSNPLSEYVKFAIKPETTVIEEIITKNTYDQGTVVIDSDCGVSSADSTVETYTGVNLKLNQLTDDVILVIDHEVFGDHRGNISDFINLRDTASPAYFTLGIRDYIKGTYYGVMDRAWKNISSNRASILGQSNYTNSRRITVLHFSPYTSTMNLYDDGKLIHSNTLEIDANTVEHDWQVYAALPLSTAAKLWSSVLLHKQGSFTQEEIDEIVTNPYQIFKRKSVSETEYCLDIASSTQSISIPFTGSYTVDVIDTDNVTTQYSGTNTFTLDGTIPIKVKKITATHDLGSEIFDFNLTSGDSVTSHTSDLVCTLSGFPKDAGYIKVNQEIVGYRKGNSTVDVPRLGAISNAVSKDIVGNDVTTWALQFNNSYALLDSQVDIQSSDDFEISFDFKADAASGHGRPLGGLSLSSTNPRILLFNTQNKVRLTTDSGVNREWYVSFDKANDVFKFTRSSGNLNLYINNIVQPGGFASNTDSFIGFKVIGGNYGIVTLPSKLKTLFISINNVAVLNIDATASNHSAGAQPVLLDTVGGNNATGVNMPTDGSAWKLVVPEEASSMSFDDANGSHYYDFTLGDPNKIHDTIGGYDATITNSNTTKWQPIIPTVSYSLKNVGGDYDQISTFVSSTRSSSIGYKTVLSVESDILCTSRGYIANADEYAEGLLIIGGHEKFNGDFTNPNVSVLTMDNSSSYDHYFYVKSPSNKLEFKNIVFKTGYASPIYYLAQTDWVFNGCGFLADTGSTYAFKARGHSGGVCILNDCVVADTRDIDIFLTYIENHGSTILNNNIFYGKNSGIYPLLRLRYTDTTVYNNVIVNTGTSESIATILDELPIYGSNNIATTFDDSMYPIGTIDNNVSTYFVDHANGDYRINETGQAALAGKGWNGSDIVSWAWMDSAVTPEDLFLFNSTVSMDITQSAYMDKTTFFDGALGQFSLVCTGTQYKAVDTSSTIQIDVTTAPVLNKTTDMQDVFSMGVVSSNVFSKFSDMDTLTTSTSIDTSATSSKSVDLQQSVFMGLDAYGGFNKTLELIVKAFATNNPIALDSIGSLSKSTNFSRTMSIVSTAQALQSKIVGYNTEIATKLESDSAMDKYAELNAEDRLNLAIHSFKVVDPSNITEFVVKIAGSISDKVIRGSLDAKQ